MIFKTPPVQVLSSSSRECLCRIPSRKESYMVAFSSVPKQSSYPALAISFPAVTTGHCSLSFLNLKWVQIHMPGRHCHLEVLRHLSQHVRKGTQCLPTKSASLAELTVSMGGPHYPGTQAPDL